MNELEAADEILRGAFIPCPNCNGASKLTLYVHDEIGTVVCQKCNGVGRIIRMEYEVARAILGLEPIINTGETLTVATERMVEALEIMRTPNIGKLPLNTAGHFNWKPKV